MPDLLDRLTAAEEEAAEWRERAAQRTWDDATMNQQFLAVQADLEAAEKEAERLRARVRNLERMRGEASARADLARFRAALTDPAAVEAVLAAIDTGDNGYPVNRGLIDGRDVAAVLRAFAAFVDEEADR